MASEEFRVYQSAPKVTNQSREVRARNPSRRYLLIQNNSTSGTVYVNLNGEEATAKTGIRLTPGMFLELGPVWCPTEAVAMLGDVASNTEVVIVEGV